MTELKIAIIVGSTRPGRHSPAVAEWVVGQAAGRQGVRYDIVDLADHPLPLYDEAVPPSYGQCQNEHTIVVVGVGRGSGLDPATILLREITVRGSYTYTDEFDRAIDLLATGQLTVADLTSVVAPLPDTLTAFDALRAGRIMKALIAPSQL